MVRTSAVLGAVIGACLSMGTPAGADDSLPGALVVRSDGTTLLAPLRIIEDGRVEVATASGDRVVENPLAVFLGDPLEAAPAHLGVAEAPQGVGAALIEPAKMSSARLTRIVAARAAGVLATTSGQRYSGSLSPDEQADEAIVWEPGLSNPIQNTVLAIDLAEVAMVSGDAALVPQVLPEPPLMDRAGLTNGDTVEGFASRLGPECVFETSAGAELLLPWDAIRAVELANERVDPRGTRIWLDDGSVLMPQRFTMTGDSTNAELSGGTLYPTPVGSARAIALDVSRITPAWALPRIAHEPLAGLPMTPRANAVLHEDDLVFGNASIGVRDLVLEGPQRLTLELPEGARWLVFSAERAEGQAMDGACELVIRREAGGTQIYQHRFEGSAGVAAARIDISGSARVLLEVNDGGDGPTGDIVRLLRPIVITD